MGFVYFMVERFIVLGELVIFLNGFIVDVEV